MRKIYLLFIYILAFSYLSNAQSPNKFNYQALIQNNAGALIPNTSVSLFIEIVATSTDGDVVFSEVHNIETDDNSMIHLYIGSGVVMSGSFSDLDWGKQDHFLKTSLDITAGNNFELVSSTQLVSVPYAMYADKANTVSNLSKELPSEGNTQKEGIKLTRGEGSLEMINGTSLDGEFLARIEGQSTHQDAPGLTIVGTPSVDQIGSRGILLRAGTDQVLANSNVLNVQNYTTDLMVVKNDGKVGIGTSTPDYKLDVNGVINATDLKIDGTSIESLFSNTGINDSVLTLTGNGEGTDIITLKNNNYSRIASYSYSDIGDQNAPFVGYKARGTQSTPSNVQEGDRITGIYGYAYGAGNYHGIAAVELISGQQAGVNGMSSVIKFGTTNIGSINREERMRISENGNVGIGTAEPAKLLDVALNPSGNLIGQGMQLSRGNGSLKMINGTSLDGEFLARIEGQSTHQDAPGLTLVGTPATDNIGNRGIVLRAGTDQVLANSNVLNVQNYTTDLMVVKNDGKVGIGTTAPKAKLQVTDGDVYIENAAKGVIMTSPNGGCWRMTVDNTGNPVFTSITCPE